MKFMLLICGGADANAAALEQGCIEWSEQMLQEGILQGGAGLAAPETAKTIRLRDGSALVTDGPFAETKDQVGGFCVLECVDMQHAVSVAQQHPAAALGVLEVRPLAGEAGQLWSSQVTEPAVV